MIVRLSDKDTWFPDPRSVPEEYREDDGCLAVGGDLRSSRLVEAYSQGIFPWSDFRSGILLWYCPMQRFVIFPSELHISHSMRTLLNKGTYTTSIDRDFAGVISLCSQLRISEEGAWLGPQMVAAYTKLHDLGYAHSVEVYSGSELVGGLYGVYIGHVFCGESMFSLVPSASKVALVALASHLKDIGGKIIDCQFETEHLKSMGGRYISYDEYMDLLW